MHQLVLISLSLAHAAEGDEEPRSRPVGGSLAGWGTVPIASDEERSEGATHLWGQLQVWTTVWDQDVDPQADPATYGDPEADPGFSLRRARLGFDGFVPMGDRAGKSQVDYALSVGVGAPYDVLVDSVPTVDLIDAFGRWALPTSVGVSSIALGLQRVPFSRENMISSAHLVFQEVAVGTYWLAPSREAGVLGSQSFRFGDGEDAAQILVRVGAFNGGGDLFGDQPGLLGAGRAELVIGDAYRTWSPRKKSAFGLGFAGLRDSDLATSTTSIEGDLLARFKLVTAMAEVVSSTVTPKNTSVGEPAVPVETARLGWQAQLSLWVPVAQDGPSGIEFAARYATYDDATALDTNGDVGILHAGATWRNLFPLVDLGAGFVHRIEPDASPNDTIRIWTQFRPEARF